MIPLYRCETCRDTGWYGDNGPGIKGNREYQPCDICDRGRAVLEWEKQRPSQSGQEIRADERRRLLEAVWPKCDVCGELYVFDMDEPFASCSRCHRTSEWGHDCGGDVWRQWQPLFAREIGNRQEAATLSHDDPPHA